MADDVAEWKRKVIELDLTIERTKTQLQIGPKTAEATRRLVRLQNQRDVLKNELQKMEQGLQLSKQHERHARNESSLLKEQMEEMSLLVRNKFEENERLKKKSSHYYNQVKQLQTFISNSNKRQGYIHSNDRIKIPKLKDDTKLPSVVYNMGDITEGKTAKPLPPINAKATTIASMSAANKSEQPTEYQKEPHDPYIETLSTEKWLSTAGGQLSLPGINLHIPPKALSCPVLVVMSKAKSEALRVQRLRTTGLERYFQPFLYLSFQPQGLEFTRSVHVEIKDRGTMMSAGEVIVWQKEVKHYEMTQWGDITQNCDLTQRKSDVILSLHQLSTIEMMRIIPPRYKVAPATQFTFDPNRVIGAMFNERTSECSFHIFRTIGEQNYVVVIASKHNENATLDSYNRSIHYGSQDAPFELCDGEHISFYLEGQDHVIGHCTFDFSQVEDCGQVVRLKFKPPSPKVTPVLVARRQISKFHDEQDILACPIIANEKTISEEQLESACRQTLEKYKEEIIRSVDVKFIMPMLRDKRVLTSKEEAEIRKCLTRQHCAENFVDLLLTKDAVAFRAFCEALDEDYGSVVSLLRSSVSAKYQALHEESTNGGTPDTPWLTGQRTGVTVLDPMDEH